MKSAVKQNVIKDDEYVYYKDEYDQVRKFIGMYISYRGTKAALHLFKETTIQSMPVLFTGSNVNFEVVSFSS